MKSFFYNYIYIVLLYIRQHIIFKTQNTLVIGAQKAKQTKPERAFRIYPHFFL